MLEGLLNLFCEGLCEEILFSYLDSQSIIKVDKVMNKSLNILGFKVNIFPLLVVKN